MFNPYRSSLTPSSTRTASLGCWNGTWLCLGFELGMATCWSSTVEGASDVSLSHTCFTFLPCTCRRFVGVVLCLGVCWFCFVLQVLGTVSSR